MAQPRRADSQHRVFNTVEFLHPDIQTCTTFQTRDGSHASEFPLTSLVVYKSFKFVMHSAFLEFVCFPAVGVVHFQRFTCESSRTGSNDPHQLGTRDFVNASDRFSLVGTLSTFKRPSCTACCSHKKRTSTCRVFSQSMPSRHASCRAAVATHVNLAFHSAMSIVQHCFESERMS